jgi:hypothetical protein
MIAVRDEEMPAATGRCPLPSIVLGPPFLAWLP